jgi:hypothetical protein
VEFLASDKASYATGSAFFVVDDGGMTLYPALVHLLSQVK